MKKTLIQLLLLLAGIAMLAGALFLPWANGKVILGLATKIIYPYQDQTLQFMMLIPPFIIGVTIIAGIYGLFSSARFFPGFILSISGAGMTAFGVYLWNGIEANDVYFLGISPLKLANVHPDIGIFLLITGGGIIAILGLLTILSPIRAAGNHCKT